MDSALWSWIELGLAILGASVVLLVLRAFGATKRGPADALQEGFFAYLGIHTWLTAAVVCAVPAYVATGMSLLVYATVVDVPPRGFTQANFYLLFVPLYALSLGFAAWYLFRKK